MTYKIPKGPVILSVNGNFEECNMIGLKIETDKGVIKLLIDDYQRCCENFGQKFLETPDDINKFIGAKIVRIKDTNDREINPNDQDSEETQLKIVTDKGVLQYAVYNSHNGYYSHATFLQVFDLVESSSL